MYTNNTSFPVSLVVGNDVLLVQPGQSVSDSGVISNPSAAGFRLGQFASPETFGQTLTEWVNGEDYQALSLTRDANDLVTSATIRWPDDSTGVLTTTNYNAVLGVYDGFTLTHVRSGYTVTQPPVIRNANGAVITKPPLEVQ